MIFSAEYCARCPALRNTHRAKLNLHQSVDTEFSSGRNVGKHLTFTSNPQIGATVAGMATSSTSPIEKITEDCVGVRQRSQWFRAMRVQETILGRLGKALHVQMDDITHEALPGRWVELILYLEEHEKKRSAPEPEAEPQQR